MNDGPQMGTLSPELLDAVVQSASIALGLRFGRPLTAAELTTHMVCAVVYLYALHTDDDTTFDGCLSNLTPDSVDELRNLFNKAKKHGMALRHESLRSEQ